MRTCLAGRFGAAIALGLLVLASTVVAVEAHGDNANAENFEPAAPAATVHSHGPHVGAGERDEAEGGPRTDKSAALALPASKEPVFDHDHADHHRYGVLGDTVASWMANPFTAAGSALAFTALGVLAGLGARRRKPTFARFIIGGSLILAAASITKGMLASPAHVEAAHEEKGQAEGHGHGEGHEHGHGEGDGHEGVIVMPQERVAASGISIEKADGGVLSRELPLPAVVVPDADRQARVPAQVVGTVAELRKKIGDEVAAGEIIALISSREVAEAKSEYLAAVVDLDLQKTLFERSAALWEKRITPEQQYLQFKASFTLAGLRVDLARQKLTSLGLDATAVAKEAKEDSASQGQSRLRTYEVRASMGGRIVERKVEVGAPVGKEGDASELYAIADLSTVWAELSAPLSDLDAIKEGQKVTIGENGKLTEGKIVFVSPMVSAETRSARVVAAFDNEALAWRPGTFVTARVALDQQSVGIRIPRIALQTVEGKPVVFVRTPDGFRKREVSPGRSDGTGIEIVSGLTAGELIAVENSFLLKADLGKSEAEHSH